MSRIGLLIAVAASGHVLGATAFPAGCDVAGTDAAAVTAVRQAVRSGCNCESAASHLAYTRCAAGVIAAAIAGGQVPDRCRNELRRFAGASSCGRASVVVCCIWRPKRPWHGVLRRATTCEPPQGGAACAATYPHVADACLPEAGCRFPVCGDGILDPRTGEECEPPGTPSCDAQCHAIRVCGDGVIDGFEGEECEPPGTATCDASCHFIHTCGNGVIEPGEECDGQPACNGNCRLSLSLCCDLGGACLGGSADDGYGVYNFAKECFIVGGHGSYRACVGTDPCPPPAPPGIGCTIGSCQDEPITPIALCCQEPDGTCRGGTVASLEELGLFGCKTFPPPDRGDIEHLVIGTCGGDGRCVPATE